MVSNGDKFVLIKPTGLFRNVGEVYYVKDVSDYGVVSFVNHDDTYTGMMSFDIFNSCFEKYVEPKPNPKPKNADTDTITEVAEEEMLDEIMENSEFDIYTAFDKCTVVSCKLPNGFVVTESYTFTDFEEYDEDLGADICLDKIADKISELERYRMQSMLYEYNKECDGNCEDCEYNTDEDDCKNTDWVDCNSCDCNSCKDYNCSFNHNRA